MLRSSAAAVGLCVGLALLGAAGCSPSAPRSAVASAAPRPVAPPGPPAFVDAAPRLGIRYTANAAPSRPRDILTTNGSGCAFLDFDRDGDPDILLAGKPLCALFRNDGTRFVDVTRVAGLARPGHWIGVACADADNDGDPDVCLTGYETGALLRNDAGRFTDVTPRSGLRFPSWGQSGAFGDIDGDGLLDLYLGAYTRLTPDAPRLCDKAGIPAVCGPELYTPELGRLFRNLGGLRFREVTRDSGLLAAHGRVWGAMFQDYDDDGRQDLYLGNDMIEGDLFHNLGGGRFENVGLASGTAFAGNGSRQGAMAVDWADYDNDGRPDLVVTTFSAQSTSLYRNGGGGVFTEVSFPVGIGEPTLPYVGFGGRFLDFDRDGWRDLLLANGHVEDNAEQLHLSERYRQPVLLLRNTGAGFTDVSASRMSGVPEIVARGAAFGDFDSDGRPDALVMDLEGPPLLLRNQSEGGRWLGLRLEGTRSNRDALGARVWITAGGRTQRFESQTSGSVLSSNDPRILAGLAGAATADVTIRWPSGRESRLRGLTAGRYHHVREGGGPG